MNQHAVKRALEEAVQNLDLASTALDNGLVDRIRDNLAGTLRSPSLDAGESTANAPRDDDASNVREYLRPELRGRMTHSDPTGSAAVQALNYGDQAATDEKELERLAKAAQKAAAAIAVIAARYQPRKATAVDKVDSEPEPGCVSCARVPGPGSVGMAKSMQQPWWNPVARNVTLADGSEAALCEWCRTQTRATGALPDREDVISYRDTGRARRRSA